MNASETFTRLNMEEPLRLDNLDNDDLNHSERNSYERGANDDVGPLRQVTADVIGRDPDATLEFQNTARMPPHRQSRSSYNMSSSYSSNESNASSDDTVTLATAISVRDKLHQMAADALRGNLVRRPRMMAEKGVSLKDIDVEDIDGCLRVPGFCRMEENSGDDGDLMLSDVLEKLRDANMLIRMIGKRCVTFDHRLIKFDCHWSTLIEC